MIYVYIYMYKCTNHGTLLHPLVTPVPSPPGGCATCRSASIFPDASQRRTKPSLLPAATRLPSRAQRARTTWRAMVKYHLGYKMI